MEYGIFSLWVIVKNMCENGMNVVCVGGVYLDFIWVLKSVI